MAIACITQLNATVAAIAAGQHVRTHERWVRPRCPSWWDNEVNGGEPMSDEEFHKHFRMCRATFAFVVGAVAQRVRRQDTQFRKALPVDKVVAMGLLRLAEGSSYQSIARCFGVARETVQKSTKKLVEALVEIAGEFIALPTDAEDIRRLARIHEQNGWRWGGLPGSVLSCDGTHIPIAYGDRRVGHSDYRNRKGFMSINTLLVCDAQTRIRYVNAKWPGSVSDARVFRDCEFGRKCIDETLFNGATFCLEDGTRLPYYVLGDAIFPASRLLMKPPLGDDEQSLWAAYAQSATRNSIERTNGVLKGRWRTLLKCADYTVSFVPSVIIACCVLHNICIDHHDGFDEALFHLDDEMDDSGAAGDANAQPNIGGMLPLDTTANAGAAWDALKKYLWDRAPDAVRAMGVVEWQRQWR